MGGCGTWAWPELLVLLGSAWLWVGSAQPTPPGPTQAPGPQLRFRLAGYPRKHNEGRVEVFYNDEWGTICDDDFTLGNAHVLCRHLGFVAATGWAHSAKYGKGVGKRGVVGTASPWHSPPHCRDWGGCPDRFARRRFCVCRVSGSECVHMWAHVGAFCLSEQPLGEVETTQGFTLGISLASALCYSSCCNLCGPWPCSVGAFPVPKGCLAPPHPRLCLAGRIWLDNVNCAGSERSIGDCKHRGWGNSDCSHEEDAGVVCKDERIPGFKDSNVIETEQSHVEEVRLRPVVSGGRRQLPVTEGIVEVRYKDGWAQICDQGWDSHNSRVICGMMGFPAEKKVNRNFYKLFTERQQPNYRLHSVSCMGTEVHLSMCSFEFYQGNSSAACGAGMPAVVSCVPGPLFATGNAHKKKQRQQQQGQARIRLKGGARVGEGRVEVLKSSEWGTICDDRWNLQSASVVCRELGFGSAKEALTGARMGQGTGPIHLNEVQCRGTEKSLWNCPFRNITQEDCKHTEDAAVRCNIPYMGYENLETWYWDASNVTEMVMSGVKCAGHEMSLSHCQHHGASVSCRNTGTRFAAGVICSETASDLLLHAPLVQETAYIEDRPLHMLYCAAEENCLASSARLANWPYGHRRLLRFSSQIHNRGRADFRPKAGRHSWVWHECHRHYHSMDIFTHYDILTPNGTKVAEGHKASFCLEDTECEEDVAKRYECANFGEQGITVGCWDLYRHDIDCQWIDITDVKPGNYILQVVINPNFEVAESDFTNNAMKCNCKYDGHRIWVHSCHIGDALSEEANKRFEQYPGQLNNQIS
uniref:Lysyl oxidase homolog n=1 Tax=Corvus moneduloides TaxID=1196302 RepID=A0A8U7MF93_CORMO